MIALSLVFLAQTAFAPTPAASYEGHCIYPPGLGAPRSEEVRVTCNRVVTDSGGVEFHDRNWDARMLRFSGEWEGDRLTVRSVTPRRGSSVEARGLCRIYYANDEVSVIACTAVSGSRSWIGNFRVSRI